MLDIARTSLSPEEVRNIKIEATLQAPYSERVSLGFAVRLLDMRATGEHWDVLRELDALENGISLSTKEATQFKHPPLFPLWHKHFFTRRHFLKNIGVRWGVEQDGNRDLLKMIQEVAALHGDEPGIWQKMITHKFVLGGLEDRAAARRITGDWIVFGKHSDKNYYLEIATHEEGQDPVKILDKLRGGSEAEFPFLF